MSNFESRPAPPARAAGARPEWTISSSYASPKRSPTEPGWASSGRWPAAASCVARSFDVTQATVSHHLKILADARLIENRREGQFIRLKAVRKTLDDFRRALGHGFDAS